MDGPIAEFGRRVLGGERRGRADVLRLIDLGRDSPHELLAWANAVRTDRFGNAVKLCAIVPGKLGGCGEDCKWCAQAGRYPTGNSAARQTESPDILAAAGQAVGNEAAGIGIVNSGRRPTDADVADVVRAAGCIRGQTDGRLQVCASLGELTNDQATRLAAAGLAHYNHNLETSRRMFPAVVSTHAYDDRLRTLAAARKAGLKLCCGGIFGLGETWADRVDLALTLRDEVGPAVVPLNFLHPIPGTPLAAVKPLAAMEILSIIAIFRLTLPDVDLKVAGGREVNLRDLQSWMFFAGATSCLIGNYLTTEGRSAADDLRMIRDLGLVIVQELPVRAAAGQACS